MNSIAIVYHGTLRWPRGIHTQLEQLKDHDVDIFFCLQEDEDSAEIISQFDYKHAELYKRPSYDWFCRTFEMNKLKTIKNVNWLSYAPHYKKSFSLLNYHNFFMIKEKFKKLYSPYDIVIVSRSDLQALFPFDFTNFNSKHLYIGDHFRCDGYQMIGQWFYGSPEIISQALEAVYNTLFNTDVLLNWEHSLYNAEGYCQLAVDNSNIPVSSFPLNCFISADSLQVENSGHGRLKWHPRHKLHFKYHGQLNRALENHDKFNRNLLYKILEND